MLVLAIRLLLDKIVMCSFWMIYDMLMFLSISLMCLEEQMRREKTRLVTTHLGYIFLRL